MLEKLNTLLVVLVFSIASAEMSLFKAASSPAQRLQEREFETRKESIPKVKGVKYARFTFIDSSSLNDLSGEISFNLFPGKSIRAVLGPAKDFSTAHDRHMQWTGKLPDFQNGFVHLFFLNGLIFADISVGAEYYSIRSIGRVGGILITQHNRMDMPRGGPPLLENPLEEGKD